MASLVEIRYDPYIVNMSILLNGNPPSEYSRLIQYSDEEFWKWENKILNVLYSELNDNYRLIFEGTDFDAAILQKECEKDEHCISFHKRKFEVSDTLQSRMKRLNQLIRKDELTHYQRTIIDAVFYVSPSLDSLLEDIVSLDVNNLFCSVRVQVLGPNLKYEETNNSVLFILAEDYDQGNKILSQIRSVRPVYILIVDGHSGVLEVNSRGWFISTSNQTFFETLFDCFLHIPLTTAFRLCIQSIHEDKSLIREVEKIKSTVPIIDVVIENEVEVNKSIQIKITTDPKTIHMPELVCKMENQDIASCDSFCVYGLKEGSSTLEIYRKGSEKPFFKKEIHVIKRNRIQKIVLSTDSLLLGIGDKKMLAYDYFPEDADNITEIKWKSSDLNVISVNSEGILKAHGEGKCRIICTAENVSAQCVCEVKPYLKELKIINPSDEVIYMNPMEEINLTYSYEPQNSIDSKIKIISSDCDVVNVVNETLYAKNPGIAEITIQNESGRINQTLKVTVKGKNKPKKKTSFFERLFS